MKYLGTSFIFKAQIPVSALTEEETAEKRKVQKKLKREKEKEKKKENEIKRKEESEKDRFLKLNDREKVKKTNKDVVHNLFTLFIESIGC